MIALLISLSRIMLYKLKSIIAESSFLCRFIDIIGLCQMSSTELPSLVYTFQNGSEAKCQKGVVYIDLNGISLGTKRFQFLLNSSSISFVEPNLLEQISPLTNQ